MANSDETPRAEARRAKLRELSGPSFDGPRPGSVTTIGWAMTAIGLLGAAVALVVLGLSIRGLLNQQKLAGEDMFASAVGLALALFVARVWHGFRTLADWRVALDVPLRAKLFAAAGSSLSASLAAFWLASLAFVVCSKTRFLKLMEELGAENISKVHVLLVSAGAFFLFLLLWYVFESAMELREWSRPALSGILLAIVLLACGGIACGGGAVVALCICFGLLAFAGLILEWILLSDEGVVRHFRANEQ